MTIPPPIAVIAGLLLSAGSYAIGAGAWGGKMEQIVVEHERRLNEQDRHMQRIDEVAGETSEQLAAIKSTLDYLVRTVQAGERVMGPR